MNDSTWFLFSSGFYASRYIETWFSENVGRVINDRTTHRQPKNQRRYESTEMAENLIESHDCVEKYAICRRNKLAILIAENERARIPEIEKKKNRLFRRLSPFWGPEFQKWHRTGRKRDALFRMSPRSSKSIFNEVRPKFKKKCPEGYSYPIFTWFCLDFFCMDQCTTRLLTLCKTLNLTYSECKF